MRQPKDLPRVVFKHHQRRVAFSVTRRAVGSPSRDLKEIAVPRSLVSYRRGKIRAQTAQRNSICRGIMFLVPRRRTLQGDTNEFIARLVRSSATARETVGSVFH